MKSGLEGRNNLGYTVSGLLLPKGLNEVRPRRPEQWVRAGRLISRIRKVSMKSGLEGRNNLTAKAFDSKTVFSLNEVRPRRPEQ